MEWLKKIFGITQTTVQEDKTKAAAFVDYEHWYYSLQRLYHLKPNPSAWREMIEKQYYIEDIMVFADFSHSGIKEEVSKIRDITNTIIETQNTFSHYKKDMTDFIMLDYIYQYTADHPQVGTYILFTGDGHFQSVAKYLKQKMNKNVVIYGVKSAFSAQLKNAATEAVEIPAADEVLKEFYPMIISNLDYVSEKVHIIPTFQGTVRAVADKNNVSEELIHAALAEMIEKGLVYKSERAIGFHRTVKTIAANWDALVKAGLWSYDEIH